MPAIAIAVLVATLGIGWASTRLVAARPHGSVVGPLPSLLSVSPSSSAPPQRPVYPDSPWTEGQPCPIEAGVGFPLRAGCLTVARSDLDGDGRRDEVRLYAKVNASGLPQSWWVQAELADGEHPVMALKPEAGGYPWILGAANADGEPGDEVFVALVQGSSFTVMRLVAIDASKIHVVSVDGQPLRVVFGSVGRLGQGAECAIAKDDGAPAWVVRSYEERDSVFHSSTDIYAWEGTDLALKGHSEGILKNDADYAPFMTLRCGILYFE